MSFLITWRATSLGALRLLGMTHGAQLSTPDLFLAFALAGNATFTLVSKATGQRFTYKVVESDRQPGFYFVRVLRGSDNEGDYTYLGTLAADGLVYRHGRKSPVGEDAPSAKAASWFFGRVKQDHLPTTCEVWHEGRCGRCGRKLTVPTSIATGLGPECAGMVAA